MIDVRFFQATATAIPTVLIATVLTSRYLDQKEKSSETIFARTLVASIIMAVSIVGEACALVGLADARGMQTRPGENAGILFFVVVVAVFVDMAALAFITILNTFRDMLPVQKAVCFCLITVALIVVGLVFAPIAHG